MDSSFNKVKLRSNRQLAAVQFLSTISLDGNRPTESRAFRRKLTNHKRERNVSSKSNLTLVEESSDAEDVFKTTSTSDRFSLSDSDDPNSDRVVDIGGESKSERTVLSRAERHIFDGSSESLQPAPLTQQIKKLSEVKYLKSIGKHKFNGERIVFVNENRTPFLVCSFIPYLRCCKLRDGTRRRHTSGSRPLSSMSEWCDPFELFGVDKESDGQEVSYGYLLASMRSAKEFCDKKHAMPYGEALSLPMHCPSKTKVLTCHLGEWNYLSEQGSSKSHNQASISSPVDFKDNSVYRAYNPNLLDNPELVAGKHRTLLPFSSYITSIIEYVKPCDLKKEINDKFRTRFPHIRLTLSKLRSIKREMRKISQLETCVDLVTVAQAYVYFEKLILLNLINKENRKPCAAASLLLSAKLNDVKGDSLKSLMDKLENVFRISRKELISAEFAVLVALKFGLHIPAWEMFPHYQRLLYDA